VICDILWFLSVRKIIAVNLYLVTFIFYVSLVLSSVHNGTCLGLFIAYFGDFEFVLV